MDRFAKLHLGYWLRNDNLESSCICTVSTTLLLPAFGVQPDKSLERPAPISKIVFRAFRFIAFNCAFLAVIVIPWAIGGAGWGVKLFCSIVVGWLGVINQELYDTPFGVPWYYRVLQKYHPRRWIGYGYIGQLLNTKPLVEGLSCLLSFTRTCLARPESEKTGQSSYQRLAQHNTLHLPPPLHLLSNRRREHLRFCTSLWFWYHEVMMCSSLVHGKDTSLRSA